THPQPPPLPTRRSSDLTATLPTVLPGPFAHAAHQSIGAAFSVAGRLTTSGHPVLGAAVHTASTNSFIHGLSIGCLVAAGVSAARSKSTRLNSSHLVISY